MEIAELVLKIVAGILGLWFVSRADEVMGKWTAYFVIAFDKWKTEAAMKAFNETLDKYKLNLKDKASDWEKWRAKL